MIYIEPQYQELLKEFKSIDDFLNIDINTVRDIKNRTTGRFEVDGQGFYIKKHFAAGIMAVLDELTHFRKPHIGAGHEVRALKCLKNIGIDTMEVVAYGYDAGTLISQRSFLVTKELTSVESLEDVCRNWADVPPDASFKRRLVDKVATMARFVHASGMNHRDFYICHFLLDTSVSPSTENYRPRLFLIDLHRAQMRASVPFRWLVKDLSGLYFSTMDIGLSKRDILRFISKYTGGYLRNALRNDRNFWLAVEKRAIGTYKKEQRRNR